MTDNALMYKVLSKSVDYLADKALSALAAGNRPAFEWYDSGFKMLMSHMENTIQESIFNRFIC